MGADNWTVCPRCVVAANEATKAAIKRRDEAYGKVPASDFLTLDLATKTPVDPGSTLAEYYYLGVDEEGTFSVYYSASCSNRECGFTFKFSHRAETTAES